MRHTAAELNSKTITMADLERGLRELNPDIQFDRTNLHQYTGYKGQRTGIFYHEQHICNVETEEIPEFNVPGGIYEAPHAVSVLEGHANIRDPKTTTVRWRVGRKHPFFPDILKLAHYKFPAVVDLGEGYEIYVVLENTGDLLARQYYRDKPLCNRVDIIGWREVFRCLCELAIPGVDANSLAQQFGVSYGAHMDSDIPMAWGYL